MTRSELRAILYRAYDAFADLREEANVYGGPAEEAVEVNHAVVAEHAARLDNVVGELYKAMGVAPDTDTLEDIIAQRDELRLELGPYLAIRAALTAPVRADLEVARCWAEKGWLVELFLAGHGSEAQARRLADLLREAIGQGNDHAD